VKNVHKGMVLLLILPTAQSKLKRRTTSGIKKKERTYWCTTEHVQSLQHTRRCLKPMSPHTSHTVFCINAERLVTKLVSIIQVTRMQYNTITKLFWQYSHTTDKNIWALFPHFLSAGKSTWVLHRLVTTQIKIVTPPSPMILPNPFSLPASPGIAAGCQIEEKNKNKLDPFFLRDWKGTILRGEEKWMDNECNRNPPMESTNRLVERRRLHPPFLLL
jgi:hypothetical protein